MVLFSWAEPDLNARGRGQVRTDRVIPKAAVLKIYS